MTVQTSCADCAVKVYNLTLDADNVYFANGVLVANCADALALTFAVPIGNPELLPGHRAASSEAPTTAGY